VHQPALYDLFSAGLLLAVLFRLRQRDHYDGFLTLVFGAWYGAGRFIEDFFRIDETHGTGLTGSQWTALVVMVLCLWALLVKRDTPWASGRGPMASVPGGRRHHTEAEAEPGAEVEAGDEEAPPLV
jgi:prolipoprotein diacylglyceryltransferase